MRVRRDQRLLGPLIVEADTAFDAGEAPPVGRYLHPLVVGIAPARQASLTRVERYSRMTARRGVAAERKGRDPGTVDDVLDPDKSGHRRDRQVEHHPPVPGQ